jgi:predicted esterase YcpF (UPF0227 family)
VIAAATSPVIVYLHGFNSSPASVKARKLAAFAATLARPPLVHVPRLSTWPSRAMADVCAWIDAHRRSGTTLAFVGSSLGGYYATWLAERYDARAVLINPAIRPYELLDAYLGPQRNLHTGEPWELTREHLAELRRYRIARVTRPQRYFLLMRSGDELIDWREAVAHYAKAWQFVAAGGTHGWEDIEPELPSVLRFAGCTL